MISKIIRQIGRPSETSRNDEKLLKLASSSSDKEEVGVGQVQCYDERFSVESSRGSTLKVGSDDAYRARLSAIILPTVKRSR